jgi:hypothetical protein
VPVAHRARVNADKARGQRRRAEDEKFMRK